jgi:hypothetical protein
MSEVKEASSPVVLRRRDKPSEDDLEKAKELLKIEGPWKASLKYLKKITKTGDGYKCPWCDYATANDEDYEVHLLGHLIHELPAFIASMERVGEWQKKLEQMGDEKV